MPIITLRDVLGNVLYADNHADFKEAVQSAVAQKISFQNANLSHLDLSDIDLYEADFSGAKLIGTDLSHCNMYKSNLMHADLTGAKLENTLIIWSNIEGAYFTGAFHVKTVDFTGTDTNKAINLNI